MRIAKLIKMSKVRYLQPRLEGRQTAIHTVADILAGRAKSVSARHYALYELDRLTDRYIQCSERLGVSYDQVGIEELRQYVTQ